MSTFTYPTTAELMQINRELEPKLAANSPIFKHFPIREVDTDRLRWTQRDNYRGMQQVRGINGQPGVVSHVGEKTYAYEPGIYGEVYPIDEMEITRRAQIAQISAKPMSIDDLVMEGNNALTHREVVLIEYIVWTLLTTGTFSIAKDGNIIHTDTYPIQTASAAVDWDTHATATPLADFRAVQLLGRGHGVSFGAGAEAYMNRTTFNKMVANTNLDDLAGKIRNILQIGGATADLDLINKILLAADLPTINIYDEGYTSQAGAFTLFVPNDKVVVVGKRSTGEPLGEYRKTLNANKTPVSGGSYTHVIDSLNTGNPVPRRVDVHRGHNGGPVIFYPSGVVVMSV
jgi:hypothetical protein